MNATGWTAHHGFEVDWGHFGALDYSGDSRKLYAFALVDAHSRMMYVEFTHCQSFETFVRCHLHAFEALGGCAHGVFRAAITVDGETVVGLKPVIGYLHRNHDKIGERNTYIQNMPFTDRLDYFNSMANFSPPKALQFRRSGR